MSDFEKARDEKAREFANEAGSINVYRQHAFKSGADFGYAFALNKEWSRKEQAAYEQGIIYAGTEANKRIAELEAALSRYPCNCQSGTKEVLEAHPQLKCFRCKALEGK